MRKWSKIGLVAALAIAVSWSSQVWAAGEITVGVAISQTGRYAEPAGRFVNSWKMYVDAIEDRVPISDYFSVIITADDMRPHSKPDPFGVTLAAKQIGVDPKECIYIGDQWFDVETAKNAGMRSCLVQRKFSSQKDGVDADYNVESLEELLTKL